jgi:hypothetical protein
LAKRRAELVEEETFDSAKQGDSPLKLRTISWDKPLNQKSQPSVFRIHPQSVVSDEKATKQPQSHTAALHGHNQGSSIFQNRPRIIERSSSLNAHFSLDNSKVHDRYKYQLELTGKEKELASEFERKLKIRMGSLRGEEKKNSRAFLIMFKKACMLFGKFHAELFFRKEFNLSMSIFFKRYDVDRSFWLVD